MITHRKRLRDCEQALANFFASGVGSCGWAPNWARSCGSYRRHSGSMPSCWMHFQAALARARKRDTALMQSRSALAIDHRRPLRHALEVRHDSFCDPACMRLLRRHNVAVVVADTAGKFPYLEDVSADFVYMRLHGDAQLYASGYSDTALDRWAARIAAWASGAEPDDAARVGARARKRAMRDVYCYFDNDNKVHAPFDARGLMQRLQLPTNCPARQSSENR
ncbi:DUF72 domain-containing protein [Xanthomonas axonopodis pv. vasculorum]|uniref:DUF72 domain-containing protein n=1 Tax=Xanthomonas axonopodis TaxID=53413 RepID=UPI0021588676|nr:DUF72 domain-containing protein [Xanthomonas axonopodis]